jgi:adenylate cyclase
MASLTPGKEFERKFIARVDRLPKLRLNEATPIEQGYLSLAPNQVRIRRMGGEFIVELKGPNDLEIELFRPDRTQGELLLHVAAGTASLITKDRHVLPAGFDGLQWEIDFFRGANAPLVMIEIEMPKKNYPLASHPLPDWLGQEVTKDDRFKNKNLAVRPFTKWPKPQQKKVLKLMGL